MKKLLLLAGAITSFASCNSNTTNKVETTDKQTAASANGTALQ